MKTFYLIDGFAFLYRAYYAVPEMKNFEGKNLNAVYGFLRMMLKRFSKHPEYLVITRDSPEKTFRHEQFPEYKAQRKKMEDDFKDQIPLLRQIVEDLGIPAIAVPGYEADDILASLVRKYKTTPEMEFYLYSGDKDLKQVLDDRVFIMDPVKDIPYKRQDFLNEFWFEPPFIVDYLTLLGDQSDNVKGVAGIGPQKASTLIYQYHTIEAIYENLDYIDPTIAKLLRAGKEDAFRSKKLIQLAEVDLSSLQLETLKFKMDYEKYLSVLCEQHWFTSFRKFIEELRREETKPKQMGLF